MLVHDYIPPRPGQPVAVVLHGLGDSRQGWQPVAPMLDLDGWGWCFAQAPDPAPPGWSWFNLDIGADLYVDAPGVRRSHRDILALLDHLEKAQGVPCERVALIGFSQGGLMTLETVLRHPRPLLAAVAISGWLHREEDWPAAFGPAIAAQRILATHGRQDPIVPFELAEPRIAHVRGLGAPVAWAAYDKAHSLDPDEELGDIRRHLLDAAAASQQGAGPGAHA